MKDSHTGAEWLLSRAERLSERYIEAERLLMDISKMNWIQRIFIGGKINRFLDSRSKYKF